MKPTPLPLRALATGLLSAALAACTAASTEVHEEAANTGPATATPTPSSHARAERLAQWRKLGYGMFVHWGLYSQLGGVWQGKPVTTGYSEQIQGWAKISPDDYAKVATGFDASKFNADAICGLAKDAGARYIVITAKHHDGFAMFDTKSTDYNIVKRTPFARDPLKLLSEACRRQGLGLGIYFSLVDWHAGHVPETQHNSNPIPAAMEPLIEQQLRELMTNYGSIAEVWFDMSAPTPRQSERFAAIVRELQPQAAINGRIWNNRGDFVTLGDNQSPPATMQPPFQTPASIYHATWGYRSWQQRDDRDGKVRELVRGLADVRAAGGNYLLNIGPMGDGSVVPFEADVLRGIGAWLQRHPEATLDAQPSGLPPQTWGATTLRGNDLFLHVRHWRGGELRIAGLATDPVQVRIDGNEQTLQWKRDGHDIVVTLPAAAPDPVLPVLRASLSGPLRAMPADTLRLDARGAGTLPANRWREGTSFSYGSGYLTQQTSRVRLTAYVQSSQARDVYLRFHDMQARKDRRYIVEVGEQARKLDGTRLATQPIGPFSLAAGIATPVTVRMDDPPYPAEDLGLGFSEASLCSECGSGP